MIAVREAIEDAVIAWLVLAGAAGGIANADAKVVVADQNAPRPPLPYATVEVIVYDTTVHTDETFVRAGQNANDPPTHVVRGLRTGTVSLNAYGAEAEAWLERANLKLQSPSVVELLNAAGLTLRSLGGINNLSALLDDKTQKRFQRDYAVDYQRVATDTEVEAVVPLERVTYDLETRDDELDSETPADWTETVTIEVS